MQGFIVVLWVVIHFFAYTKFDLSFDASFISITIMLAAQLVCCAVDDKRH